MLCSEACEGDGFVKTGAARALLKFTMRFIELEELFHSPFLSKK
jgi:hypothetical protein